MTHLLIMYRVDCLNQIDFQQRPEQQLPQQPNWDLGDNGISKNQIDLINKQKIIENQNDRIKSHNIDNEELEFLRLNLEYGKRCIKKNFSKKGFKVGTPEYKNCVLKKGRL